MTDMSLAFIDQAGAVDGEYSATGTPFTNDAVTYTSSNTVTTPALGKVVMFGGNDLQVKVGNFSSNATIGGTTDVTTVGFLADMVVVMGGRGNYAIDTAASQCLSLPWGGDTDRRCRDTSRDGVAQCQWHRGGTTRDLC